MREKVDELVGSFSIDLSNYYTKSQTNTAISTAIGGISLANYYTKDETYTQSQVSGLIDTKIAGIVVGDVNSANQLTTARTIAISGGATGTATSFNGTANITIPVTALDASKLSGAIPSTVTATTQAITVSNTTIATTEFVKAVLIAGVNIGIYSSQTEAIAASNGDMTKICFYPD
jgi:hypothetical protein